MIRAEPNYVALSDAWEELDDQIDALQSAKRNIVGTLREEHGKLTADAFKAAMKIRRMDGEKRQQAEAVDTEAYRILGILSKPRHAPRATRTREIIEKFDAETGEIIEQLESVAAPVPLQSSLATRGADESVAPIPQPQSPVPLPAAQPEAVSLLPAVSGTNAPPAPFAGDDGHPSIPTTDALAAGAGEQSPGIYAKSVGAVTINERCLKPATCKFGTHPHNLTCAGCTAAWAAQKAVAA